MNQSLERILIALIAAAVPAFIGSYTTKQERLEKEAKSDTIALFIQHQNQLNEKLHNYFATVDSNVQLSAVADSTAGN